MKYTYQIQEREAIYGISYDSGTFRTPIAIYY